MRTAKRIITACLTAIMTFQALAPSTQVFAQELDAAQDAMVAAAYTANDAAKSVQGAVSDLVDSASKDSSSAEDASKADSGTDDGSSTAGEEASSGEEAQTPAEDEATDDSESTDDANADETEEDAAAAAETQTEGDYKYKTLVELKTVFSKENIIEEKDGSLTIKLSDNKELLALSNADPSIYEKAKITNGGSTGAALDATATVTDLSDLSFRGLGNDDNPFEGTYAYIGSIKTDKALFNNVKWSSGNSAAQIEWTGVDSNRPIVASKINGNNQKVTANVTVNNAVKADKETVAVKLSSPLFGEVSGTTTVDATYVTPSQSDKSLPLQIDLNSTDDNIGLLANTLAANGSITVDKFALPKNYYGDTQTVKTEAAEKSAGSLIGECADSSTVTLNAGNGTDYDFSKLTVVGKEASGGLIGKATNLTLSLGNGVTVKPAQKVGDANSSYSGGIVGDVSFASEHTVESGQFNFAGETIELGANKRAGGLFGRLDVTSGDVTIRGGTYKSKLAFGSDNEKQGDPKSRGSYGGIAGIVSRSGGDAVHALLVEKDVKVEIERAASLCYIGGIIGYLGDNGGGATQKVAAVLNGPTVTINGSAYAYTTNGKLGGAVGVVDTDNVLDVRGFTLKSNNNEIGSDAKGGGSAGIVGSAWCGVIKLSGATDLSGATFAGTDTAAQLVYENRNALIFATGSGSDTGWTFKRPAAVPIDDIHDYGEVLRLGDKGLSSSLIDIGDNFGLTLEKLSASGGNKYVLNDKNDFAKFAITWQAGGKFSLINGISENNVADLKAATIEIPNGKTIELSGTGLIGLGKDCAQDDTTFSGTLTGDGTINLAVGERYGKRGDSAIESKDETAGNGKIYRHQRLGLFSAVSGATVTDGVTIGGTIRFENKAAIDAGSLAAQIQGNTTIGGGTFSTTITYASANDNANNVLNVGGIAGLVTAASTMNLNGSAKAQAEISTAEDSKADCRVGEAFGAVDDCAATINASGLTIGGSIDGKSNTAKNLVGGFIGYINQGSNKKYVNITGLHYSSFAMTVGKNGDPKNGAGGLLGYSWGNTIATVGGDANNDENSYALTTSNASVTADSATEFGGLLYVMSGHLVIQNRALDLTGASLSATSATSFGVLLARGGTSDSSNAFGVETAYTGLYLEDKTHWDEAYRVKAGNNKLGLSVKSDVNNFDEWIADTTKPGSSTSSGEANAVISLHTQGDILYMGNDASKDNSYQNRTDVDMQHKTNQKARYYYNLDRCLEKAAVKEGDTYYYDDNHKSSLVSAGNKDNPDSSKIWAKSAEALMIWSARRYAPDSLREYIAPGLKGKAAFQIGNSNLKDGWQDIDLYGYSYYPVDSFGGEIIIKNVTIKFHYTDIRTEQENVKNKSNAKYTQHANMHMALFRAVDKTLTVGDATNRVKLAGSVGRVVKDSDPGTDTGTTTSGALVCRSVTGTKASLNWITLEGLTVDGAGEQDDSGCVYAPLLINNLRTKVTLDVQNLSVESGSYDGSDGKKTVAASSLFGNLGGEDAEMVTAKFSNISLPSLKTDSIFTHASFLESFGYKEGTSGSSGSYIFYKGDSATYGSEIDANGDKNEYVGDQLWYYNEDTYKTNAGLVTVEGKTANIDSPVFGDYLPYVAKGQSGAVYHELKVNQRLANIKTGCGTYADPYALSSEFEIKTVAEYINNESRADDEWEVTITKNQSETCARRNGTKANTDNEITYKYQKSSGGWISTDGSKTPLDNKTMHAYLQSAYYSIEPKNDGDTIVNSITLNTETFKGFGNESNPFRGVIVGNLKNKAGAHTKLIIKGVDTFKGLISYSYGSVVKDLDIEYDGADKLTYGGKSNAAVPNVFFGGVIGCIMGGDNIIEGVSVSSSDTGYSVTASGDKSYLVPVGGYVGAICGGGVIFRNMSKTSWHENDASKLYDNPFVGRVIDGYAFSEGCEVDNGNDNYQVNELQNAGTPCVTTDALYSRTDSPSQQSIVTLKNAQGLLVLSAIINSGAAAGPTWGGDPDYGVFSGVAAYKGSEYKENDKYHFGNAAYGKVRNASYNYVGLPSQSGFNEDFVSAKNDDQRAPGVQKKCAPFEVSASDSFNSPYLIAKYANAFTGYICGAKTSGIVLKFDDIVQEDKTFDMRKYGSGFLGLSGRYYSNACNSGELKTDRDRILPAVASIVGNNQTLLFNTKVEQYNDDDYSVQAVGGLFDTVMFIDSTSNGECLVRDLQIGKAGEDNASKVSLTFKNGDGISSLDYCVGALAGVTANRDSLATKNYKYQNVKLVNVSVDSPKIAGGLLGASGWASRLNDDNERYKTLGNMVDFDDGTTKPSPVKLVNCSYQSVKVQGKTRVGGFVGAIGSNSESDIWVTDQDLVVGSNSEIVGAANDCVIGGVFGLTWSHVATNVAQDDYDSAQYQTVKMYGVSVRNNNAIASGDSADVIRGTGGIVGNTRSGCQITKVLINGVNKDSAMIGGSYVPTTTTDTGKFQSAGGIVGQVNGGSAVENIFDDIVVENVTIPAKEGSGGLVGTAAVGSSATCSNIDVENVKFGETYAGALMGTIKSSQTTVTASNIEVAQCEFWGEATAAISGDGKGTFRLSNVLLNKNKYTAAKTTSGNFQQGLLLGKTFTAGSDKDLRGLYVAGLDVIPEDGKKSSDLPDYSVPDTRYTTSAAIHKVSYVALADYNDVLGNVDGNTLYNDEGTDAVASASPYVTTNPVSSISIKKLVADNEGKLVADSGGKLLFGDGVATYSTDGDTKFLAGKIKAEALNPTTAATGAYAYNNIGGCDSDGNYQNSADKVAYNPGSADSTFNANNPTDKQATPNMPVLVISGNDTTTVASYLNVITNGGYSDAVRLNGDQQYVTATVKRVDYDSTNHCFVESDEAPSLSVDNSGKSTMAFHASTAWDNNEGRFTLLTVTFNDGAAHTYKVQVPVIVKRMLEIDFTATYSEGTNFNKDDYSSKFENHVLISGGEAMTGYLTWTYNNALGVSTEYGWNTHLASGGAMRPLNKTIEFAGTAGTLPNGTQLTLVDTADNNKEYRCVVGKDDVTGDSVKLTQFYRGSDDNKTYYKEKWLSESFSVKATESKDGSGQWVELTGDELKNENKAQLTEAQLIEKAGAKVGGKYYRARKSDDADGTKFYDLTVDTEGSPSENFYLIVRAPKNTATTSVRVNGDTETSITTPVNTHINYRLRELKDGKVQADGHQNTASTYSIASNYSHDLKDNVSVEENVAPITMQGTTYRLEMNVSDTITFGDQQYTDQDRLYYQLDSSLVDYDNAKIAGAKGYPAGTGGTYSFYVMVGDKYYSWKSESSSWKDSTTKTPAAIGSWNSTGGDMTLTLNGTDGKPLDLKGLRTAASADKQFMIIMEASLTMTEPACMQGIVASQNSTKYTKPNYRASLSTHAETLKTSSNTAYIQGNAGYYRQSSGASTITLDALDKAQLGININDLQSANGTIGLEGTYDIGELMNRDAMISNATNITYTLTLQQRQNDGSYKEVEGIDSYIEIAKCDQLAGVLSADKKNYTFLDNKKEDGLFRTSYSTGQFKLGFEVKVNTDVEKTYANYRLVLTAKMTGGGVNDSPEKADYVTYTLTKIRTDGIAHNAQSDTTS